MTINGGIRCDFYSNCKLTITGTGRLTATTPDPNNAGIGGDNAETAGTIKIEGGIISATGGQYAAGIGGGNGHAGGQITISGGEITAKGGQFGAGIGGGNGHAGGTINIDGGIILSNGGEFGAAIGGGAGGAGGTITITGGTTTITNTYGGAGIGCGQTGDGGTTIITGGSINTSAFNNGFDPAPRNGISQVYKNTLTAGDFHNSPVTGIYNASYGLNDVVTDGEGKLYFYLPTSGEELLAVSFDEIDDYEDYYGVTYARTTDKNLNIKTLEYLQLAIPNAAIDYTNEILTGLVSQTNYDISIAEEIVTSSLSLKPFSAAVANGAGEIPIDDSWLGNDIDIKRTRTAIPYADSVPQSLNVKARRAATEALEQLVPTAPKSNGASGTISGLTADMEYSTDPDTAPGSWTTVGSAGDLDLPTGTYYFREIADNENFATDYVTVIIPEYLAVDVPDSPDSPADSENPGGLNLATTGLNLDLAYLLALLLLAFGTVLKKRVISV